MEIDDKRDKMRAVLWELLLVGKTSTLRFDALGIPIGGFREKYDELQKHMPSQDAWVEAAMFQYEKTLKG